ncbi:hypothetical protein M9H77_30632 [Catharanthus roseus]|uniref:Uncharacterized protein n=1 Tax=Catharanthus roseus TaxID=4058 RepID=A0ACB9ZYV6_CATRO|nr:hypothetical protein M9H77_30632 [Catharanthus roseus]
MFPKPFNKKSLKCKCSNRVEKVKLISLFPQEQSQTSKELKLGPMTRGRMKKLNASNGNRDNVMIGYLEEAFNNKFEEFEGQEKTSMLFSICSISKDYSEEQLVPPTVDGRARLKQCFITSMEGPLPIQSHQEGTRDPSRINLNETLRSMQQSTERLVRDIKDLKKGKSTASMDQRIGDNFGGVNSPHHQRPYDNMSTQGYHDM